MDRYEPLRILLFLGIVAAFALIACAGANGDPAPVAQEAGTTVQGCVDAGATE